jgi:hypothetical protein
MTDKEKLDLEYLELGGEVGLQCQDLYELGEYFILLGDSLKKHPQALTYSNPYPSIEDLHQQVDSYRTLLEKYNLVKQQLGR